MGKKNKIRSTQIKKSKGSGSAADSARGSLKLTSKMPWQIVLPVLIISAIVYIPVFQNQLTNWDDEYYVVQNALLRGPDWKGIFTQPVVSNYHPLTIITLAINYSISGLDASSYVLVNLLLHLINTGLVFYFIYTISRGKIIAAAFTALIFGIHPMHVESVAWVSERKDVLYTLFFLLSLIQYWRFLGTQKNSRLIYVFIFFVLSLLSKPAAIILPLLLFLMDYWYGRPFNKKVWIEKIPFLIVALLFAVITVKIQSKTAIAGLDFFPLWTRFFFATYAGMTYIIRFLVPYPLSAFHPFPSASKLGLPVLLSPVFMVALLALVWFFRRNKLLVFCFFFFIINLLLVLQVVSIGATLVAERYTYVPYIGIGFFAGMLLEKYYNTKWKRLLQAACLIFTAVLGFITFQRIKIWKDSDTLWTDVIDRYPNAPVPKTNRANYLIRLSSKPENKSRESILLQRALADCNEAIKVNANHAKGYENRQNIYLRQNKDLLALADAYTLIRLEPRNRLGYYTKGVVYVRFNQPDSALESFNKCLSLSPNTDFALNNRGSLLYNHYRKYKEAITDFDNAIRLNPQGDYYLNRSYCYYQLGLIENAKTDARIAMQKGVKIPDNYKQILKL